MISRPMDKLTEKNPSQVVIGVNGVGYEADVPMQTFYNLSSTGETVHLYTRLVIHEDAHLLFGSASAEERAIFRQLVKVNGIGTRTALGTLSVMNADELAQAVAEEDVKRLSSTPDIGKEIVERMVLGLCGKLISHTVSDGLFVPDAVADKSQSIINTLLALGYDERETKAATKDISKGTEVDESVRLALKNLLE